MKTLVTDYAFNASAKTVTLNGFTSIDLEKLLVITNVTDNIIVYNFADATKGGTVASNVLTLTYDTTSMSNTDKLQIWYDDTANSPATAANQARLEDAIDAVYYLAKQFEWLGQVKNTTNSSGYGPGLTIFSDTRNSIGVSGTLTGVTGITNLGPNSFTTQGSMGRGYIDAALVTEHLSRSSASDTSIKNIIVS